MSKHPVPDWLRSQFSRIEDDVRKLGPCGVFTQMRTVTQTYFEQLASASKPPTLGGESGSIIGSLERFEADGEDFVKLHDVRDAVQVIFAPLQAEIERLKASEDKWYCEAVNLRVEHDQLKARNAELECDHEWTDDGEFNLHCTKCGKQENHEPYGWVQTRGNAINHFTQEWDVVEEWEAQGFEYKAMFDAALSKPAEGEQV